MVRRVLTGTFTKLRSPVEGPLRSGNGSEVASDTTATSPTLKRLLWLQAVVEF
jgi:hypothetical protein